ncbi:TetR family transcriptional regulator [Ancylobacter aquaticus]|uniref:TetR family transcriptional regulator n=1 Tax=Ancylobacter aquaticus TaxID=100 RepID=A0A4R1I9Q0_ANCAQ|nr:TetR/AcrR family transcriptional regulator [Ancylobacter aquaticus]TCK30953.1 TetR family transcriptional regulator [Ancylobacter aquaticus]
MGRRRTIDRGHLLDCAEQVIVRCGAANLTLEAVAIEAGISKASVIYDYKTKKALIRALVERRVAAEEHHVQQAVDSFAGAPNAKILGYVAAATRTFSDEERAVGLNLCAALAQDDAIREPVKKSILSTLEEIESGSTHPDGARLAFLALQGIMLLDWLNLHQFEPGERDKIVRQIGWLAERPPIPPSISDSASSIDLKPV